MTDAAAPHVDERRPHGWRSSAFDLLVALVAIAVGVGQLSEAPGESSTVGVVLVAVSGAVLVWRRYAPASILALTLALTCATLAIGDDPRGVSALVALYTTALMREPRVSLACLVPAVVVAVVLSLAVPGPRDGSEGDVGYAIGNAVLFVGVWGLGAYMQTRRRYLRELEARADQLEREREQLAQIAVMEERTSIARDLHDIVAHSVTVMLLGVRGARDVLRTSPGVAEDTLARVEATGEQSVAELRRILALLREPHAGAMSRPQPSLADLEALAADHRAGGLPVRLTIAGSPRPLPGGVELSIYRIVQEALTNVVKHSRANGVTVTLSYRAAGIEVEVIDDGVPLAPDDGQPGHGLVGMRERIALLGGTLEAGPRDGRGFRVAAWLPVSADA
jgi:signal transduction histidine kinase